MLAWLGAAADADGGDAVGMRFVSRAGVADAFIAPPGRAAAPEKVVKSLSQKRSVVPRASRGRTSVKRPFASGHVPETGLITPRGPSDADEQPAVVRAGFGRRGRKR